MWARFITTDYVAFLFFTILYHVYGGDAQTVNPPDECENECKTYLRSLIAVSSVAGLFLIVILVGIAILVKRLGSRKSPVESSDDLEQPIKDARHKHHKGRISYYELGKLVRYAFEVKEDDKLEAVIKSLMNDDTYEIKESKYGATDKDRYRVYQDLCDWKKQCENQTELLFAKCIAADMVKSIRKLTDLRGLGVSFSTDLKLFLERIANKSPDNITNLLKNLHVENVDCDHSSGSEEIVHKALEKLEKWKEGLIPMNPGVMLILVLEDLKLNEGGDEHIHDLESTSWSLSEKNLINVNRKT